MLHFLAAVTITSVRNTLYTSIPHLNEIASILSRARSHISTQMYLNLIIIQLASRQTAQCGGVVRLSYFLIVPHYADDII